jgi:DNA invertase Pin-like site-specific DNA recombinase
VVPYAWAKIQSRHRDRLAVVYVRQSTPQQVQGNQESTALQYGLRQRALELGWPLDRVLVIDDDLGRSGQSVEGRLGFQRVLAEVGLDHVGLILGVEMSRLARSCKDWHQLLELCALFQTLLADQDGLYDPSDYNDRLLLGLKGTMSEAELHIMRNRLHQGMQNKARRGELYSLAPIGYVRASTGEYVLDPDEQVQSTVRLIFAKFEERGSISGVLTYLVRNGIRIGIRFHCGPNKGQLEWRLPNRCTLSQMLHHPIYAGAYTHGRRTTDPKRKKPGRRGTGRRMRERDEWDVLLKDHLQAYITWEQYEAHLRQLAQNRAEHPGLGAPREGPTLLSGLIVCGRCGRRLLVSYGNRRGGARYTCGRGKLSYGEPICQSLVARPLDELAGRLVLQVLEPAALELSLRAGEDIERERARLDQHWQQRLERARYDAERARRQYQVVEPENRLVARELERRWEQALQTQLHLEEDYERFVREQPAQLTAEDRERIRSLATDLPTLWQAPTTTPQERQRIIRHLIEHVVVNVRGTSEWVDISIHWLGGYVSVHEERRPIVRYDQLRDYAYLIKRIEELRIAGKNTAEVATHLNREGFHTPKQDKLFDEAIVRQLVCRSGLSGLPAGARGTADLPQRDEWWAPELARKLGMPVGTLNAWRRFGWIHARHLPCGTRGRWILWADKDERRRLRRLRDCPRGNNEEPYPRELTTPKKM